jgi:membrane protease YdiL (CAAX protease family)
MTRIKPFIIRLLFVAVPLLLLYFYAQMAFEANRHKEHPTDAGLGIAILLVFILIVLFIGFLVDFIKNLRRKQYKIAGFDFCLLLLFTIPVIYIGCLMTSRDCFCGWLIDTIDFAR